MNIMDPCFFLLVSNLTYFLASLIALIIIAFVVVMVQQTHSKKTGKKVRNEIKTDNPDANKSSTADEGKPQIADVIAKLTQLESQIQTLGTTLKADIKELQTDKSTFIDELLSAFKERQVQQEASEQARRDESERLRQEQARTNLLKRRKQLAENFRQLESENEMLRICRTAKPLLSETAISLPNLIKSFSEYVDAASSAETLAKDLADGDLETLENRFQELERRLDKLSREHRAAWFTTILDEASKKADLKPKVAELKDLLRLEEVWIEPGSYLAELDDLDVVASEGLGQKPIVSEVVEHGYRLSENGAVVRRPKVKVRFEV